MDERTLRQKAREALQNQRLPNRAPDRMWGGPGDGATCALCGDSVERDDIGFDLEFADDGNSYGKANYALHARCFSVWELERENPLSAGSNGGTIVNRDHDGTYGGVN
jgi:hypothetical protein